MLTKCKYIPVRELTREFVKIQKSAKPIIVMRYSQPCSIVLPFSADLLTAIEQELARKELLKLTKKSLREQRAGKTKSHAEVKKMFKL